MKETNNHPYITRRTVKAWELDNGKFLQIIDVRDIFHNNYSVELEVFSGGLDSVYSSTQLDKCMNFVKMKYGVK